MRIWAGGSKGNFQLKPLVADKKPYPRRGMPPGKTVFVFMLFALQSNIPMQS